MKPEGGRALFFALSGLALLAGASAAVAHPPWSIWPGLIGYPLLVVVIDRSLTVRGAFWYGWLAGFAYFLVGCWWVAEAFLVNPEQAWMAPFAASLLPAGLGLFWGSATAFYRRFRPDGSARILLFVALFCIFEWLRGHILTGFPWNLTGATWPAGSAPSQVAAWIGVYGLGLLTLTAVAPLALLAEPGRLSTRGWRSAATPIIACVVLIGGLFGAGAVRLAGAETTSTDTVVRLVQPEIGQAAKWEPDAFQAIVSRYVELTAAPSGDGRLPDVIIWPEGALPITANDAISSWVGQAMDSAVSPGQTLLAGFSRGEADPDGEALYYNSLLVMHDDGRSLRVGSVYDKHRLVPFGEFLPLGDLMTAIGFRSLVHVPADFSHGPRPAPIDIPGAPLGQPLICYESLYPGLAHTNGARPAWIVNVSNDAWFGPTSGPLQHLNLAAYRAIESGLPMARSTPTGVSAMIDPYGRVIASMPAGESGFLDVALPQAIAEPPYARTGDFSFAVVILGFLLALKASRRKGFVFFVTHAESRAKSASSKGTAFRSGAACDHS